MWIKVIFGHVIWVFMGDVVVDRGTCINEWRCWCHRKMDQNILSSKQGRIINKFLSTTFTELLSNALNCLETRRNVKNDSYCMDEHFKKILKLPKDRVLQFIRYRYRDKIWRCGQPWFGQFSYGEPFRFNNPQWNILLFFRIAGFIRM